MKRIKVSTYAKIKGVSRAWAYVMVARGYDEKKKKIEREEIDGMYYVLIQEKIYKKHLTSVNK